MLVIKKDILVIGEGSANGLAITVEDKCSANFTKSRKKACLSLHCNGKIVFCMLTE